MTVLSCCIGSSLNSLSHHHVHIRVLGSNEPARGNKDNDEVFCVLLEPENFSVAGDSLHGVDPGGRNVKGCSVEVFYYFAVLESSRIIRLLEYSKTSFFTDIRASGLAGSSRHQMIRKFLLSLPLLLLVFLLRQATKLAAAPKQSSTKPVGKH
jgi:hypothetical protein